jgi:hypothetical protein
MVNSYQITSRKGLVVESINPSLAYEHFVVFAAISKKYFLAVKIGNKKCENASRSCPVETYYDIMRAQLMN